MARSRLSLPMLALAVVVSSLALVPAPLVTSAVRPPAVGRIGRFSVRPVQARKIRNYLIKHAGDLLDRILNILPPSGDNKGDKLDTAAARSAAPYTFTLPVGTASPPQNVTGVLDITLSFVWAQCDSCAPCLPPPAPVFMRTASPTFSPVLCASDTCQTQLNQTCSSDAAGGGSCGYVVFYGDDGTTNTSGTLANDTFTFGDSAVPSVLFGCSDATFGDFSGASGSFGFGRGALSLATQLQLAWFSYFLASDDSDSDNLLQFGDDAFQSGGRSKSTPLVGNEVYPDLYYVKLRSIQVDGRDLTGIPAGTFDIQAADGSGGVFLTTISPVTYLEEAAYDVLRRALVNGIGSDTVNGSALGLDLCYSYTSAQDSMVVPKLTLVFDGPNAAMELRKRNYFFADNDTGLECLTILPSRGGSALGSLLQADTTMTYDIDGGQLFFETAFAPPPHYAAVSSMLLLVSLVAWVLLL